MSKGFYFGVGGKAKAGKAIYVGVGGKAKKVKKAYIGVNGKARLFYEEAQAQTLPDKWTYTGRYEGGGNTGRSKLFTSGILRTTPPEGATGSVIFGFYLPGESNGKGFYKTIPTSPLEIQVEITGDTWKTSTPSYSGQGGGEYSGTFGENKWLEMKLLSQYTLP